MYFLQKTTISGKVQKIKDSQKPDWGIQETGLFNRNIRVTNLPMEFQEEGTEIRCNFSVDDVVGTGAWDTYASVSDCKSEK
jgi:hypothetical protein